MPPKRSLGPWRERKLADGGVEMRDSTLTIRGAVTADIALCKQSLKLDTTAGALLQEAVQSKEAFVAVRDGGVVGVIVWHRHFFGCAFIALVLVAESARREGIAGALLRAVDDWVGTEKLFTSTNESNAPAQALFSHLGFRRSGHVENLDSDDLEILYFKWVRGPRGSRADR